jgi:hypothetical protein
MSINKLEEFLEYSKSYLASIDSEYESFIRILIKSGFSDEKEFLQIFLFPEVSHEALNNVVGDRLNDVESISNDKIKDVAQLIHGSGVRPSVNLDGKFNYELSDDENGIFQRVTSILLKLYINFISYKEDLHGTKKAVVKSFVHQWISDNNSILGTNSPTQDILNHLNTIRTPSIEDLLTEKKESLPINTVKEIRQTEQISLMHYWNHGIEKLHLFYKLLLDEKLIEENSNFINSFKEYKIINDQQTIWNGKQTHLVYLFYYIYNGTNYKGRNIYSIIALLFCKPDRTQFKERNLNTSYTSNSNIFTDINKTPKSFLKMENIIETLDLSWS